MNRKGRVEDEMWYECSAILYSATVKQGVDAVFADLKGLPHVSIYTNVVIAARDFQCCKEAQG